MKKNCVQVTLRIECLQIYSNIFFPSILLGESWRGWSKILAAFLFLLFLCMLKLSPSFPVGISK
eukprot:c32839_g1_i1 orf=96-287(+)